MAAMMASSAPSAAPGKDSHSASQAIADMTIGHTAHVWPSAAAMAISQNRLLNN